MALLTLFLLIKRGITAVRQPPEEVWLSGSVLMVCCCTLFGLWAIAASVVHYGQATQEGVRARMPLPGFGLALAAPVGVGAWMYASHATGIPLLAFETGALGACITMMIAIAAHEGQQLSAILGDGGSIVDWWRPERPG